MPEGNGRDLPLRRWLAGRDRPRWALGLMLVVWSATFIVLGWMRHDRFSTYGFDLGIYDQGAWLLSQFKEPFVTIRGLNLFGHHTNVIVLALVPFYRLGAGPEFLLVVQVLAQATGAIAVYLLARDRLGERWLGVAMAAVLLLNPTYQFLAWEYFHPDTLAIAPLLFAYWAARAKRWPWFWIAVAVALACKEDVALSVAVLGVLVAVRGKRRIGVLTSAIAACWYLLSTRAIIPALTGLPPFYESFFPELGDSGPDAVRGAITRPGTTIRIAVGEDRLSYFRMLLAPLALLPLFALPTFAVALPMLAVNVFNVLPFTRDFRFHYSALVLAGGILATVEAIVWLGASQRGRRGLVAVVLVAALASTVAWGPSPISTKFRSGHTWPLREDPRQLARERALSVIPAGAATSAAHNFSPHLTHRRQIYEFPVPWRAVNWGVKGEGLPDPTEVRWILVDRFSMSPEDTALLDSLMQREFAVRFDRDGILAAERVAR